MYLNKHPGGDEIMVEKRLKKLCNKNYIEERINTNEYPTVIITRFLRNFLEKGM
jgi:cytochrome b involved in lipid metabolism